MCNCHDHKSKHPNVSQYAANNALLFTGNKKPSQENTYSSFAITSMHGTSSFMVFLQ